MSMHAIVARKVNAQFLTASPLGIHAVGALQNYVDCIKPKSVRH